MPNEIIVFALGGNAISTKFRTFDSQYNALRAATKEIASLAKEGYRIVITHGNGPQVGDALLRNECSKDLVPPLPLYACVAGTQGVLGSMIQVALLENLGKDFEITSLVTKVKVLQKDPAFKNPTKPIGAFFSKDKIRMIKKMEPSAIFREVVPGKFRRIVPSPEPISILEINSVRKLVDEGYIVVACGGGGIPVINGKKIHFTEAVVDKDLTSGVLAASIGASFFINLTDVQGVYQNFKSKNKKLLRKISTNKIKKLIEDGSFEEGSMEPKVRAAMKFATSTGKNAVIASIGKARKALELKTGTVIYK